MRHARNDVSLQVLDLVQALNVLTRFSAALQALGWCQYRDERISAIAYSGRHTVRVRDLVGCLFKICSNGRRLFGH